MIPPLRKELSDQRELEIRRAAERSIGASRGPRSGLASAAAFGLRWLADHLDGRSAIDRRRHRVLLR